MDIEFVTIIRDLQSAFDNQTIKPLYIRRRMESFDWRNYYSVEDIFSWLRDLSEKFPKEVKLSKIGESVQNRNILAVTIELAPPTLRRRSVVVVEGGCHAREWISPAFVTYLINNIVNSKKSTNEELKTVAHAHKWVFVPLLNPDGYAYSQMTDRLWRKNLNGVDLNRNFGVAHGRFGAQATKESEDYCGDAPFSEPESSALASFLRDHSDTLEYYISFHSYGQYIVIPYAFEKEHMDNYDVVKPYADKIATRSSKNHGIHYFVGTAFDTVGYLASGVSSDWVKKSLNVPYTITIELPDQGFYGFALPKDRILPTCEATMDSILPFLMAPKKGAKLRHKDPFKV
ncbi:zinc carboxypeptidase-like [Leguminivora glycinivorella]|uniref:zinc carboxypeptidase-like n=1 Tax=Leguminivora glycinivorella TaxID=1035111 RepID=UPI00200D41A1|nr:zinc carboxypeptidase-like [Leguminivora glycinivorella]